MASVTVEISGEEHFLPVLFGDKDPDEEKCKLAEANLKEIGEIFASLCVNR